MTKLFNSKILFFTLTLLLAVTVSACIPQATNTNNTNDDAMMEDDNADDTTMQVPAPGSDVDEMIVDDGDNDDSMMEDDDKGGDAMMEETKTFNISGQNFEFSQKEIRVKKGDKVVINFTSASGFHDWVVDEFSAKTAQVQTGGTTSVEFIADKSGTYEFYCSVGSHRAMGMVGSLIVEPR